VVNTLRGKVFDPSNGTETLLDFDMKDFSCTSDNPQVTSSSYYILKSKPSQMHCDASAHAQGNRKPLGPGTRQFLVTIVGDGSGEHRVSFCFDLSDQSIDEVFAGTAPTRIMETSCENSG